MRGRLYTRRGQSLIEVVIATAVLGLTIAAISSLVLGSFIGLQQGSDQLEASALAREAVEAVRAIHDRAWNEFTYNQSAVEISSNEWIFSGESTTETIGKFTRTIDFADVCRDSNDDIVTCPGSYTDPHTKLVIVTVEWEVRPGVNNQVEKIAYLTNWESGRWVQTDWSGGSGQSIWSDITRYDSDDGNVDVSTAGKVQLASSGGVSGCSETDWDFSTPGDYTYDTAKIEVTGGAAQLKEEWWDTNFGYRQKMSVTTGAVPPQNRYNGYTVSVTLSTSDLIRQGHMQSDCDDLRIIYQHATEIDRHVIDCNTNATTVNFQLQADISDASTDEDYYMYYGDAAAGSGLSDLSDVYLWYDDALADGSTNYTFGRGDAWHGTGGTNSFTWNASGYYTYDTGDNATNSMRLPNGTLSERDAYIEAEFFHTNAYPNEMTSGLVGRYIADSGYGTAAESADHYYASNRADSTFQGAGAYSHDRDIMESSRGGLGIDGSIGAVTVGNQWRKQALALWGINNTNGKFWDNDTAASMGPAGFPTQSVTTSGSDASDQEGSGEWGLIVAQDAARVRNILVRRYTEPEPTVALGGEEARSADSFTQGLWHLDEASGNFADASANANNLTPGGDPTYAQTGQFDNAVLFDSTADYGGITDASQTGLDITGVLTIDAWINPSSDSGIRVIASKYSSGADRSYGLYLNNQTLNFIVLNGSNTGLITSSAGSITSAGGWYHVAGVYTGNELYLFINGASAATPVSYSSGIQNGGADFRISTIDDGSDSFSFDGLIDEVRISNIDRWRSAFTPPPAEVGGASGYPTDNPTINPTASFTHPGIDAWLSFDETATKNGGEIYYQLSDDDGATWYYWNGSAWAVAGASNYNTASVVNTNIWQFPTANNKLMFKAFLESDGTQQVILDNVNVGCDSLQVEAGTITVDDTWTTVNLTNVYDDPLVFASTAVNHSNGFGGSDDPDPATVRVRNKASNSFQVRREAPNGASLPSRTVTYLVIERGRWSLGGLLMEADSHTTSTVGSSGSWTADTITYDRTYTSAVALHQVVTDNDTSWIGSWVSSNGNKNNPPGTTDMQLALMGAEATSTHGAETIDYMIIEDGTGTIDGTDLEATAIGDGFVRGFGNGCYANSYQNTYASTPLALGYLEEMDGGNGGWSVTCDATSSYLGLTVDEDTVGDTERNHTTEAMAFMAFEAAFNFSNGNSVGGPIEDNDQGDFDQGTYSDTQWDTNHVELTGTGQTNGTGTYTSRIFNRGSSVTFNTIDWVPTAPYGKELPGISGDWWNGSYQNRRKIVFGTAHDALPLGYTATLTMDTRTSTTNVALASGDDVRIVWQPNAGSPTEIDRIGDVWDDASTDIEFRLQSAITANANEDADGSYYVYYNNAGAGTPPTDEGEVYFFADYFNRGDSSTVGNGWTEWNDGTSDMFIQSNTLRAQGNNTGPPDAGIKQTFPLGNIPSDFNLEFDWTMPTNPEGIWTHYVNIGNSMSDSSRTAGVGPGIYNGEGSHFSPNGTENVSNDLSGNMENNVNGGPHAIRLEVDVSAETYDYYRNDGLIASAQNWVGSVASLNQIRIATDQYINSATPFTYDDLKVRLTAADTEEASLETEETPPTVQSETAYAAGNANMSGIQLLYHLNEASGTIADSSGNGNSATQNGGVTYGATGIINDALSFDGGNDYLTASSELSTLRDTSSMSFWINTTQSGNDTMWMAPGVTGIEESGGGDDIFWGWIDASGNIGILKGNTAGAQSSTAINDGNWHHIVLTWNSTSGESKVYVDGTLEDTQTTESGVVTNTFTSIGRIEDTGGSPEYFQGLLDEIAVYDRVIGDTEAADLHRRGALRMRIQVRSCDDAACSGESFIGPDGTGSTYYEEADNSSISLPSFTLTNVTDNQYFQYRVTFETDDSTQTPELRELNVDDTGGGGGSGFAAAGELTSSAFDTGSASAIELIEWDEDVSGCTGCDIQLQVRAAPDSSGSPGVWTSWYGAAGAGTYFIDPAGTLIPTALNGNQWIQYRAELSGNGSTTPELLEVRINYK